ncbi:hypothetical protein E1281_03620 [Actinomadura sp. KC345]|uniref:hypothetical protein n=1 Tax=Actinomadura sp. KC345 TaxID=2530371 RepID=UPI0010E3769D|nr:hypothetical protein [Actinomadura sp. KC345]TDC57772.1 hypothetical protein E1281_03620 [Actinomadura sp. KC345]
MHAVETLTTPTGEHVQIDCRMVPLVQALWDTGIGTFQCCEDVGASVHGGGWLYPKPRRARYAAFWDGFAWLQLPLEDAERLVALTAGIAAGHGWECSSPITVQGRRPGANLYLPARQIDQVLAVLKT